MSNGQRDRGKLLLWLAVTLAPAVLALALALSLLIDSLN